MHALDQEKRPRARSSEIGAERRAMPINLPRSGKRAHVESALAEAKAGEKSASASGTESRGRRPAGLLERMLDDARQVRRDRSEKAARPFANFINRVALLLRGRENRAHVRFSHCDVG